MSNDPNIARQAPTQAPAASTFRGLEAILLGCVLSACATTVFHVFGFDMRRDDQDAVVLEYRYGNSSDWIGPKADEIKDDRIFGFEATGGYFTRPEFLYVKWRNRTTGQVFEDKADLRKQLPRNFDGQEVYFMIRGAQLYVYLISQEPRPAGMAPNGPRATWDKKTLTIYPDAPAR